MLQVTRTHPDAELPLRQTGGSVGYDLVTVESKTLQVGERYAFDTGLAVGIPVGCYGRIGPRSGLAFKKGLDVMAGIIDLDYALSVKVILVNLGQETVTISAGDRVAQLILERCETPEVIEVPHDELSSTRMNKEKNDMPIRTGGFGSTGTS